MSTTRHFRFLSASFAGALLLLTAAASHAEGTSCDRACLKEVMDQYTAAMAAHDPSKAPLADDLKFTENGQVLTLHDGLWSTASADTTYRLYVIDPEDGAVGLLGKVEENGNPALLSVRLKVVDGKITEAEQVVVRPTAGGFANPDGFDKPFPILMEKLKPSEQSSREDMIKAADAYFTGLDTENSGKNVPFAPNCQRRENGMVTANSKDPKASAMAKMGCKAQFDTGFSVIVTDIRDRRFLVIDRETGLIYSAVFFDHSGQVKDYTMTDGTHVDVKAPFNHPLTFQIAEIFKIKSGKIVQIEALVNQVPYRMRSRWSE